MKTVQLSGRSLVIAMCIGQVGNLLPHVAVPAVMAQHLMPEWGLSAAEAGLLASSFAIGYMLAVPALTALTDRIDARSVLFVGSAASGLATLAQLTDAGVRRISVGGGLARNAWAGFLEAATEIKETGSFAALERGVPFAKLEQLFDRKA